MSGEIGYNAKSCIDNVGFVVKVIVFCLKMT